MAVQIQLRRGTAAEWTDADPVLAEGEVGVETDTGQIKIGDGSNAWSSLDYFAGGGGGGGSGTVTSVSVATANGLAGTVANPTTTPAITLRTTVTGLLKGNGTSISAAAGDTDYATPGYVTNYVSIYSQPIDSELTAIAMLTSAADRLPYFTGSGTASLATFTAAGRALVDDADAAAQRATLGLDVIAAGVFAATPIDGTIVLTAKAAYAFTLAQIRGLKTSAGACSVTVQINGTGVTGLTALSVTSTPQDASATAANAVAVGDRVTVVISSVASAADLEFTLKATR